MVTEERLKKIDSILGKRQKNLRVVLECIENQHNASAILRTCDAVGVLDVDVILPERSSFLISPSVTTGAERWLRIRYYNSTEECLKNLKSEGFKIVCTCLDKDSLKPWDIDFSQRIAVVFGNEKEGVSEKALALSDMKLWIPMMGMVKSLNVSVSAGVILYEAMKQRFEKGLYGEPQFDEEELNEIIKLWCGKI